MEKGIFELANKRMFTMKIVDTDAFLDMPLSTQCLYFHLNMRADDDGFIGNPKRIEQFKNGLKNAILAYKDGPIA